MKTRLAVALAAVSALAPAAPASAASVKYKGKTSQKLSIALTVDETGISKVKTFVKNNCGATKKPIVATGPIEIEPSGRFAANFGDGAFKISGRFSDGSVTGQLRHNEKDPLFGRCDTGKVTFSGKY